MNLDGPNGTDEIRTLQTLPVATDEMIAPRFGERCIIIEQLQTDEALAVWKRKLWRWQSIESNPYSWTWHLVTNALSISTEVVVTARFAERCIIRKKHKAGAARPILKYYKNKNKLTVETGASRPIIHKYDQNQVAV